MNGIKKIKKQNQLKYMVMITAFFYTVVFCWYNLSKFPLFSYEKQGITALIAFIGILFFICVHKYAPSNAGWGIFLILYCVLFSTQLIFLRLDPVYVPIALPAVIIAVFYKPYSGISFHLLFCVSYYFFAQEDRIQVFIHLFVLGVIACFLTDFMKNVRSMAHAFLLLFFSYVILFIIWMQCRSGQIDYFSIFPGLLPLGLTMLVCFFCILGRKMKDVRKKVPGKKYIVYCNEDFAPIAQLRETSLRLFYHTLEVADLSAAAASAAGADGMLARAGAMYHDIGKIMSSNYVKAGVLLAKEYKLPREVIQIIEEHNGKIRKPQSVESAVVLLADTLVATRDYMMKTNGKMEERKLIEQVMSLRLDSGLLDESGITLVQFREIKRTFINMLCGGVQ